MSPNANNIISVKCSVELRKGFNKMLSYLYLPGLIAKKLIDSLLSGQHCIWCEYKELFLLSAEIY